MSLSSTKLSDANHEISIKQSAKYNVRETDRYGENTQNSLPYSTRVKVGIPPRNIVILEIATFR